MSSRLASEPDRWKIPSAALADQVKSLDWGVREASHKGKVSSVELVEVRAKIFALIGNPSSPMQSRRSMMRRSPRG